jgi:hypothetical protein
VKKFSAEFVLKVAQLFNISADQLLRDELDLDPEDATMNTNDTT